MAVFLSQMYVFKTNLKIYILFAFTSNWRRILKVTFLGCQKLEDKVEAFYHGFWTGLD